VQKTSDNPLVELTGLRGEITLRDGPATIRADKGAYDLEAEKLMVIGDIVFDAMGYKVLTGDAILDLQTRTLVSPRGLNGTGPLGTFKAETFRVNINNRSVVLERGRMRITPTR
jgi:lipopolysaccharide export system protein LptC